jgi:NarL family two-component system response regulator LiaR
MLRSGLAMFLKGIEGMALVAEASNGAQAVALCREIKPDVVLMDLVMPEMDGVSATRLIREVSPNSRILVLTTFNESELVQSALQAGAIGYLLKNASVDELATAIRAASQGRSVLAPEALQSLINRSAPPPSSFDLTDRERTVLTLMVEGLTNRQIAERMSISASTVKSYVSTILSKLNVASRTEAVAFALQHKLVN